MCDHSFTVWGDDPGPINTGVDQATAESIIEVDRERRYAECEKCGTTLNG